MSVPSNTVLQLTIIYLNVLLGKKILYQSCQDTHCYGNSLNLAAIHTLRNITVLKSASMNNTFQNYEVLMKVWDKACKIIKDTQTIARIEVVASQIITSDFFMALFLERHFCTHTDNLSRTLQHSNF